MATLINDNTTRRRHPNLLTPDLVDDSYDHPASLAKPKHSVFAGWFISIIIVTFYTSMLLFVRYRLSLFPEPKTQSPTSPLDEFYEMNARIHLKHFSLHGPRVVGSDANEIYAYKYILDELTKIKKNSLPSKQIEIDEHKVSGAFDIAFLSDFVSVYRNIKNVIVKLHSETGSNHSLLMSCHFDSSVESPGAGDNAISCSVMLELLRVFSQSEDVINHSIIFLFNGAEENLLQASHGFITQHRWADSIKAFVNIDSAGAGGWEMVFQTGPAHPWLVKAYAESSPYPSGTIFGQEVFQSGLIPSDTDYRIYRDFGEIPGLDIAYITNGYVYHTKLDQNRFIHDGCVQRGGENLLALLKKLSSSPHLADPGDEREGSMVFFDILGYFMVCYPHTVGSIINSAMVATILFKVIRKSLNLDRSENHDSKYFRNLMIAMGCVLCTWLAILLTCLAMALVMTGLGHNMSWFTHVTNLVPVFYVPAGLVTVLLHNFFRNFFFKRNSCWYNEQVFFEANLCVWGVVLLLLTVQGIGSACLPMLYLIGPLFIRDRTMWISKNWNWRSHPNSFLMLHMCSQALSALVVCYVTYCVLLLFIPIMGRAGSEVNPDIAIGVLSGITAVLMISNMISLLYLCHGQRKLTAVLAAISVLGIAAIMFTSRGFPYHGNHDAPSPFRLLSLHTRRRTFDIQGVQTYEDSGIWMLPFDYNHDKYIVQSMPTLQQGKQTTCDFKPYCGLPYLIPLIFLFHPERGLYVPVEPHSRPSVSCTLVARQVDTAAFTKLTFQVTGPDHMSMMIQPRGSVKFVRYSFVPDEPVPSTMPPNMKDQTVYYVYYSHGETPSDPWTFSLYFQVPPDHDPANGLIDLGFSGQYLHGPQRRTDVLDAFNAEVPDWATPLLWTATWDGYVF